MSIVSSLQSPVSYAVSHDLYTSAFIDLLHPSEHEQCRVFQQRLSAANRSDACGFLTRRSAGKTTKSTKVFSLL